jgi:hypothetical protein
VPLSTAMEQSTPVITPSVMASARTNHLFIVCRRLWAFWEHLLRHRAPPVTVKDAAESVVGLLSSQSPHRRHGSWSPLGHLERREPLGVWWVTLSTRAMIDMLQDHLKLWLCSASRKMDTRALLSWCKTLAMLLCSIIPRLSLRSCIGVCCYFSLL